MTKKLIINADDFNLTAGVSRAIYELAMSRIVTSTSAFVNGNSGQYLKKLCSDTSCGIGLHITVTCGKPILQKKKVQSLVNPQGSFMSLGKLNFDAIVRSELEIELEAQLKKFFSLFFRKPTHIDSHHHVHSRKKMFDAMCLISRKFAIPMRQRFVTKGAAPMSGPKTTDSVAVRYDPKKHWTKRSLLQFVRGLKEGITELVVHPGFADDTLKKKSSFNEAREREFEALLSKEFSHVLKEEGIELINYGDIGKRL